MHACSGQKHVFHFQRYLLLGVRVWHRTLALSFSPPFVPRATPRPSHQVIRAAATAEKRRNAEFGAFLAWARGKVPAEELGDLAPAVLSDSPRLELSDVAGWADAFKGQLAKLAVRCVHCGGGCSLLFP